MPLVMMRRDKDFVDDDLAKHIAEKLPRIVSFALNSLEERLVSDDIEVWVSNSSDLDVNVKPLEIIIWATDYPERKENLYYRRKEIVKAVKELIPPTVKGFVWIILQPTSFGVF